MSNQHVARSNKCLIITILHLPHRIITPRNVHTTIRFRRCPMHADVLNKRYLVKFARMRIIIIHQPQSFASGKAGSHALSSHRHNLVKTEPGINCDQPSERSSSRDYYIAPVKACTPVYRINAISMLKRSVFPWFKLVVFFLYKWKLHFN